MASLQRALKQTEVLGTIINEVDQLHFVTYTVGEKARYPETFVFEEIYSEQTNPCQIQYIYSMIIFTKAYFPGFPSVVCTP